MYVITRDGKKTPIRYDKITDRNVEFASDLNVDVAKLSKAVIAGLKDGMYTSEIDNLSAETAFYMSTYEPEFDKLAVRIAVSNLHKSTNASFSETIQLLKEYINPKTGKSLNIISNRFYNFVQKNKEILDSSIVGTRDFKFSYFGFKTLQRSYLLKCEDKIVERPQYMWLRVACGIHMPNKDEYTIEENNQSVEKVLKSYELMSQFYFTHASPTLFNAGSNSPQCSSCFLLTMDDDLRHIYTTNFRCAVISKHAGGIGIDITRVRAKGSTIHSTNGKSNGIVPMIKVFNSTAQFCDQSGKRKGSIAMYLEPWHPDVLDFLQLRFNLPPEDIRARDIFIAMWMNDLFMKRVEKDEMWSLFCPNSVPQLTETYGDEFESIYSQAEKEGKFVKQIKAQEVWKAILHSQMETGLPYICYKDSVNKKSNQKNLGIVRSSNLCVEIMEVTENNSIAVCNLSSIGLPVYVDQNTRTFDYVKLGEVVEIITENLNKVIDINFYPLEEAKTNNLSYRPIGIGIQGLADVFALLDYSWGDKGSKRLNRLIMETIYYHALKRSCELSKRDGPYDGFYGSPASQGILQYHMWNTTPLSSEKDCEIQLDWNTLIKDIKEFGLRNSLLIAHMPTASTAQIMGNNESHEPFTTNIFSRSTLAGDFSMVNKHLYSDLKKLNLWTPQLVDQILAADGSIQHLTQLPEHIRNKYKTIWELSQKISIDYAADRAPFIDQSQSLNIYLDYPTHAKLTSMHFYGWKKGLKTGSYYIHSKPARSAVKFTVSNEAIKSISTTTSTKSISTNSIPVQNKKFVCVGEEGCLSCGS